MIVTPANINDAREILELQKLAYQIEGERYNDYALPPLTQTLTEMEADIKNKVVLKAVIDEQIVGSVRAYVTEGTCYIGRLIVQPDLHNQGIGTRLMHEIEECFDDIVERFELFTGHKTAGALHLYHRMGYREFKRREMDTHILIFLEKYVKGGEVGG